MRVDLARAQRVATGDSVCIRLRLPKSCDYARISVWSACGDDELSPHIQNLGAKLSVAGEPRLLSPMYATLSRENPEKEIRFTAEHDMTVVVRQEKDIAKDPSARARISAHGQTYTAIRLRLRNAFRALGGNAILSFWRSRRNGVVRV